MRWIWLVPLTVLLGCGCCSAQTLTLTFSSDAAGIALSGSGTSAASVDFGAVQAFGGTLPSGVTKNVSGSSWTLSTKIDVQVQESGLLSTSYTLSAQLQAADMQNTWKWNSVVLTTTAATISSSGAYGTNAYNFGITVPFSVPSGTINNSVDITVVAN